MTTQIKQTIVGDIVKFPARCTFRSTLSEPTIVGSAMISKEEPLQCENPEPPDSDLRTTRRRSHNNESSRTHKSHLIRPFPNSMTTHASDIQPARNNRILTRTTGKHQDHTREWGRPPPFGALAAAGSAAAGGGGCLGSGAPLVKFWCEKAQGSDTLDKTLECAFEPNVCVILLWVLFLLALRDHF